MKATAATSPTTWNEKPYNELPSPMRMTKASVDFSFKGPLEGKAQTEFLMFYESYDEKDPHKSTAIYIGLTNFTGTLDGKTGSFVMEERGTFKGGAANSTATIVAGSGTDQLKGITGSAQSSATQTGSQFELNYELT
jgi:hypothetical protein